MAKKGGGAVTQPFQSNTTGSAAGTTMAMPIAPEGYETNWNAFQPGQDGFTGTQQPGVNWLTDMLGKQDPANLGMATGYFQDALATRENPTLRNLEAIDPSAYATPADVEAQQIAARRGSEFMADYQNPYQEQVVDTSLALYDQSAAEAQNAMRSANAGAFGNKRYGVAEGQFAADSALGRAGLGANLRAQGFNTAAGLGMADAGRFLSADQANQSAALQAAQSNRAAADARRMFDAQQGLAYNDQRDRTAMNLANLGTTGFGVGQGLAQGLVGAGAQGQGQNLNWLGAGTPLFGQTGTTTGTTSGTTSGYQTGINQAGGKGGALGGAGSLLTGISGFYN